MRDFHHDHSALALNTATLGNHLDGHGAGWSPERIIDACAERGFGAISWWRREVEGRAQTIGDRTRAAGMAVSGLCRAPFLVGPLAPQRVAEQLRAAIDTTAALGAPCLTVVVGGIGKGGRLATRHRELRTLLAAAAPWAEAAGIRLALEPLHPVYGADRSCLVTVGDAVALCDELAQPALALAIDVYHVWWDRSLTATLSALAGRQLVVAYHLCDWLADTRDVLLDRGMMGDGVADLRAIRKAVEASGYTGYCEVEIFSAKNWWRRDPAEVLDICVDRFRRFC